jgi:hypothetical protein
MESRVEISHFCTLNYVTFCLGFHHEMCEKFQKFLLEEFGRLFKMYILLEQKEIHTSEKLIQAVERSDELEVEIQRLQRQLDEFDI